MVLPENPSEVISYYTVVVCVGLQLEANCFGQTVQVVYILTKSAPYWAYEHYRAPITYENELVTYVTFRSRKDNELQPNKGHNSKLKVKFN